MAKKDPPAEKKVTAPKVQKAPPDMIFGQPLSAVARALGQQTDVKAKVVAAFVASKGFKLMTDTIVRQCLRARRCLDPQYGGAGEGPNAYYKLGPVPKLTKENLAEFNAFVRNLPPEAPKVPAKKEKKEKKDTKAAESAGAAVQTPPAAQSSEAASPVVSVPTQAPGTEAAK